jgi:hypothetical protein
MFLMEKKKKIPLLHYKQKKSYKRYKNEID